MNPTIGLSEFFCTHSKKEAGNSFTTLSDDDLLAYIQAAWDKRTPGDGETDISRKVLVPLLTDEAVFFLPPRICLKKDMPLKAEAKVRQEGEDPYLEVYVDLKDAEKFGYKDIPACYCDVVCYSADALLENNGKRTTNCEWEVVTLLCRAEAEIEPMAPLVMARNFLEKPGGTKGEYTAKEFAEAIYHHSSNRSFRVRTSY